MTDEAMLNAIDCPESYSDPLEVYAQAKRRGMDFFTITDHDTHQWRDADRSSCRLCDRRRGGHLLVPRRSCKMHILVWDSARRITQPCRRWRRIFTKWRPSSKSEISPMRWLIPIYRQNDRLERWHLERLVLIFKGFETLNGCAQSCCIGNRWNRCWIRLTPADD